MHHEGDGQVECRGRSTEAFPIHSGHCCSLLSLPALPEGHFGANTPFQLIHGDLGGLRSWRSLESRFGLPQQGLGSCPGYFYPQKSLPNGLMCRGNAG